MEKYNLKILQDKKIFIIYDNSIGSFENESFSILFENNSANLVQANILINDINILSGKNDMDKKWAINPYDKLKLSAWQETAKGGAEFRFTKEDTIQIDVYESNSSTIPPVKAWSTTSDGSIIDFNNYEANRIMEIKPYFLSNNFKEQLVVEGKYSLDYSNLVQTIKIKCENWTGLQSKMRGNRKMSFRRFSNGF